MFKILAMSLILVSLPACQPWITKQQFENLDIRKNSESRTNIAGKLTPFTASMFAGVQAESSSGLKLDVGQYTLPSHLWAGSAMTPVRSAVTESGADTDYSLPGELALHLHWDQGGISVGRQVLETPFLQTDDAQLVPNLFESANATIKFGDNLGLSAYYVDKVSDWQFGADKINYSSLGNSLGKRGTEAATIVTSQFTNSYLNSQVWFYHLPDIEKIGYLELKHFGEFTGSVAYELSAQIDWARATGAALLGEIESTTLGVRTGISWSGYSIFGAFNQLIAGSSTAIGIGGDPYYTSLEYRSFADIGSSNAYAVAAGIRYKPEAIPLEIELTAGRFKGGDKSDFDVREIDLSVGYTLSKDIDLRMFFSSVSGQGHESDDHRFAFSLNIPF